jgi:biotin synthase
MIGIGPYIAHPATPLGDGTLRPPIASEDQVQSSEEMVCKMVALARLVCPSANIPATTALATLNRTDGRKQALRAGANVVMPNLTPRTYRRLYQIYPGKACIEETAEECNRCLHGQIRSLGRFAGCGAGGRGTIEIPPAPRTFAAQPLVEIHG